MTRADLLALTEEALTDLTNRGTVRRALKEADGVVATFSEQADGTLVVTTDVRCEIPNAPFADWTCSCLAGTQCRHLVRAVLLYQAASRPAAVEESASAGEAGPPLEEEADDGAAPDLTQLTDEVVASALGAARMRAAWDLLAAGALGEVGQAGPITLVRLHFPVSATVRFLAGADLNYVRCSCREPDPCRHLPLALAVLRGPAYGATNLHTVPGPDWQPDAAVLAEVRTRVNEVVQVGLGAAHRSLTRPWERLVVRARAAQLHHLADLSELIVAETARYARADHRFDPTRMVGLLGEVMARTVSLEGTHPGRIPDRLVAGSASEGGELGRARLIGLGTEISEADEDVTITAFLVDARSGALLRVGKNVTDPDHRPGSVLAAGLAGGLKLSDWGGGQVVVTGGKVTGAGTFSPGNRRVSGMPRAGLDQLEPPFGAGHLTELAGVLSQLPPALADRSGGGDLAACRIAQVTAVWREPALGEVRAQVEDAHGVTAQLAMPLTARTWDGVHAAAGLLRAWQDAPPQECFVAGRWHLAGSGLVLTPLLLAGDDLSLQPFVAPPEAQSSPAGGTEGQEPHRASLGSAAAVVLALERVLGQTVVAGMDRIASDPRAWRELTGQLERAGCARLVDLARSVTGENGPDAVVRLLVATTLGGPLL